MILILALIGATCLAAAPPGWTPPDWQPRYAVGQLLLASPSEMRDAHIGNGYVATFAGSGTEFIAGVFNGALTHTTTSHRAELPSVIAALTITGQPVTAIALDLELGAFLSAVPIANSTAYCVVRSYAHRAQPHLLITDVTCNNTDSANGDITVVVDGTEIFASSDVVFSQPQVHGEFLCWTAATKTPEVASENTTRVAACHTAGLPAYVHVPAGQVVQTAFVSARYTSVDTDAFAAPAQDLTAQALAAVTAASSAGPAALWTAHATAQLQLWDARIEIVGNLPLARAVNASLYALLASVRADVLYSSSPGGLGTNSYNGHSFWDVETWQWPPLLMLHPDIAQSILQYRVNRQAAAAANALLNKFEGLMYPWESAFSGTEVDPAPGTTTEEHLQGDIAFAFRQYWYATGNLSWLATQGFPVIHGIATFWASKAVPNPDGSFSIPHIMGPDEYHGNVTDSVYCNVGAQIALLMAFDLAPLVNQTANQTFQHIATNLVILFDAERNYHPEYAGYTVGTTVKQADTILLGYPLLFDMPAAVRANDLRIYENVTDPGGPAMTWSMFAISYGEIGEPDLADSFFQRGWVNNTLGSFYLWHETSGGGGCSCFITGAGGFLQAVYALYGGIRLVNGSLLQIVTPRAPPDATGLVLRGIHFLGSSLLIVIRDASAPTFSVALLSPPSTNVPLGVSWLADGPLIPLTSTGVEIPVTATAAVVPLPA